MNLTNKIIPIDEDTQIKLLPDSFMLQFKVKTRTNQMAWHTEGYYPSMTSLSHGYLNHAPYRAMRATEDFEKLLEVIRHAEETMKKVFEKEERQQ